MHWTALRRLHLTSTLVVAVCGAMAAPTFAKPATVACGALAVVNFDDATWVRSDRVQEGTACDLSLDPTPANGFGLALWGIELKGKEKQRVEKDKPATLLQNMINMLSKGNKGFTVTAVASHGPYHWAAGRHTGPNDKTYDTHIAVSRNAKGLFFVVWEFDPGRAPPKVNYDVAVAKARFLGWLDAIQPVQAKP